MKIFHIDKTHRYGDQRDLHLEFIKKHLTIKPNTKWLDLGCGLGEFLENMGSDGVEKHGIDIDEECIEITRRHVPEAKLRVGNVENLPYKDQTFDLVTALFVLEHVENPTAFIREALRVTKTGGKALFSTPNIGRPQRLWYASRKKERWERSGHRQGYDIHLMKHCLENNGWRVEKIVTRFVDCPFYYALPRWLGNYLSKTLLPRLVPNVGSEMYAFCKRVSP
jgi:ubiquinone/menaquinone biosynthesis C-methylase UbiE